MLSLASSTLEALKNWLSIRPQTESPAIFTNFDRSKKSDNQRITRYGIYKVIKKLGEENNVTIHPHSFRHSSVTVAVNEAQKNNINLREVLKFSRHSKLETLQIYVDSIENKQGELSSMVSKAIHLKKVD